MPFDAASFVDVSRLLSGAAATAPEQGRFRTAVSRAYYGPLIALLQRIEQVNGVGSVPVAEGTHRWVRQVLKNSKRRHLVKIKQKLDGLRERREQADYHFNRADFSATEVGDAILRADRLINELRTGTPDEVLRGLTT